MPDYTNIDLSNRELLVERGASFIAKSTLRGEFPSLAAFAGQLIRGYGEGVRPHIEKIWADAWSLYKAQ